jgi:hypothetical protein
LHTWFEQLNGVKRNLDMFCLNKELRSIGDKMVASRLEIVFFVFLGCLLSVCDQLKEAGRTIGHTTWDVATALAMALVIKLKPLVRE